MQFECHYCPAKFKDFTGLVKHFEAVHRNKKLPASEDGMPIIEEAQNDPKS
jgi:hypothetical protein